jgi:hypothetical protein
MKDNYFYMISNGEYVICDIECCSSSENTIDLDFNLFAMNKYYIDRLNLLTVHIESQAIFREEKTETESIEMFAGYLAAFCAKENAWDKLKTNPTIRLLLVSDRMKRLFKGYSINKDKSLDDLEQTCWELHQFINENSRLDLNSKTENDLKLHQELIDAKNEIIDIKFIIKKNFNMKFIFNADHKLSDFFQQLRLGAKDV